MTETVCVTVLAVALTVLINARASEEQQLKQRELDMQAEVDRACGVLK